MGMQAEMLLLSTGLLAMPEKQHARAIKVMPEEFRAACEAIVDQAKPTALRVLPRRPAYYDRLVKDQSMTDYAKLLPEVTKLIGPDEAGAWQLLRQAAIQRLIDQRPVTEIQTLVGPSPIANSPQQDTQYALDIETVEVWKRLLSDVAAGAIMLSQIQLFAGLFPETYKMLSGGEDKEQGFLLGMMRTAMRDKKKKDISWYPSQWLDGALRVFLQVPFDAVVNVAGPKPNGLGAQASADGAASGGKLKLNTAGQQTQSQAVDRPTQSKA